ncbi:MAG: hypothetical protein AAF737_07205, partial [Pseudomonadota bacterium]
KFLISLIISLVIVLTALSAFSRSNVDIELAFVGPSGKVVASPYSGVIELLRSSEAVRSGEPVVGLRTRTGREFFLEAQHNGMTSSAGVQVGDFVRQGQPLLVLSGSNSGSIARIFFKPNEAGKLLALGFVDLRLSADHSFRRFKVKANDLKPGAGHLRASNGQGLSELALRLPWSFSNAIGQPLEVRTGHKAAALARWWNWLWLTEAETIGAQ